MRRSLWYALRAVCRIAWHTVRWVWRHKKWALTMVVVGWLLNLAGAHTIGNVFYGFAVLPGLAHNAWAVLWPQSHEAIVARPLRQMRWESSLRSRWAYIVRESGLSTRHTIPMQRSRGVQEVWVDPTLEDVEADDNVLRFVARCRVGQTTDDLTAAVPTIAAAMGAHSHRAEDADPSAVAVDLVMGDLLKQSARALPPHPGDTDPSEVVIGRREDGSPWSLVLRERHTLVAGCSGAGKGSVLWGVCGGLAPAVRADSARLLGVDLKAGLEVGMGSGLFATTAYNHEDALQVMRELLKVIEARGAQMIGVSRAHVPTPGNPLYVLVIDELAALVAYEHNAKARAEAQQLLSKILTQGRALGVIVVAFVQDPSKETVKSRNLFTQTVALRIRTSEETRMVLGEGMAPLAPAHKINPDAPGTGWIVTDTGAAERVRANYWTDDLVRETAARFPAPVSMELPPSTPRAEVPEPKAEPKRRRSPRASRRTRSEGSEAA